MREIGQRAKWITWLDDRPWPDQAHDEIAEHQARHQNIEHVDETVGCFTRPSEPGFFDEKRNEADQSVDQSQPTENSRADRQPGPEADDQDSTRRGSGIF